MHTIENGAGPLVPDGAVLVFAPKEVIGVVDELIPQGAGRLVVKSLCDNGETIRVRNGYAPDAHPNADELCTIVAGKRVAGLVTTFGMYQPGSRRDMRHQSLATELCEMATHQRIPLLTFMDREKRGTALEEYLRIRGRGRYNEYSTEMRSTLLPLPLPEELTGKAQWMGRMAFDKWLEAVTRNAASMSTPEA